MEYKMEWKNMTVEQLEARKAEIAGLLEQDDADLLALEEEVRGIRAELEARKAAEEKRAELRRAVAGGVGEMVRSFAAEAKNPKIETRNTEAYINAYAEYIKTGNDSECRALLTTNSEILANPGQLPVPVLIEGIIKTAWESDEILSRVRKTSIRGNLKVPFELSADGAYVHAEGTSAVTEESLTLGIVTMVPAMIKKWITISDEVMAIGGEAFLRYIYEELAYQITKKLSALVVADIAGASTSNSSSAIGVAKITEAPSVVTIPNATAHLSDNARNLVVIMNRLTEVEFISAYAAGNFAVDPFAGLTKVYTSALPAYSTASSNAVYAIVGDLDGAQINYPEGDGVVIKFDDLSLAESDLIKVVGREYAAHAVTGLGMFTNIAKPAPAETT